MPLNSKQNTVSRLCRVAAVSANASVTNTRLMIAGKLSEMGHDPRNVQVVAQGDCGDSPLYLVSDVGIIKSIEKAPRVSDVTAKSCDTVESLCSALCEANEARDELQTAVQN